jgi:hypothetical protein
MTANHCRASRSNYESRHSLMTASLIVLRALLTIVRHEEIVGGLRLA